METTPGPWKLTDGRTFETASGEFYLAYGQDRYGNAKFRDFCELDANARLIAAAPDLLAACIAMRMICRSSTRAQVDSACDLMAAAIDRATGQEVRP